MRCFLFIVFFVPVAGLSQSLKSYFERETLPDSVPLSLIITDKTEKELENIFRFVQALPGKKITTRVLFEKVAGEHQLANLPVVDFGKYELGLRWICAWCITRCNHEKTGQHPDCHRQACQDTLRWVLIPRNSL